MANKIQINLDLVEKLAARGITREQVAHNLGISRKTFQRRSKDDPLLEEAYQRGKAKGITEIANALYDKAKNGNTTAQIFFLKCNGWKENSETTIKIDTERNVQQLSDAELFEIVENSKKTS